MWQKRAHLEKDQRLGWSTPLLVVPQVTLPPLAPPPIVPQPVVLPRAIEQTYQPAQLRAQARAYASISKDIGKSDAMVTSTLSVLGHFDFTLFNFGSTHSFIFMPFVVQGGFEL